VIFFPSRFRDELSSLRAGLTRNMWGEPVVSASAEKVASIPDSSVQLDGGDGTRAHIRSCSRPGVPDEVRYLHNLTCEKMASHHAHRPGRRCCCCALSIRYMTCHVDGYCPLICAQVTRESCSCTWAVRGNVCKHQVKLLLMTCGVSAGMVVKYLGMRMARHRALACMRSCNQHQPAHRHSLGVTTAAVVTSASTIPLTL
jgi:hypothetical protein